ncbi:DEAD/DEAH box helicase [Paenibacillus sp. GCM10023252]|uniref:DEAD/DEAH box helicase n=1 Tax=Paenibacillus sp. GCM10023252 TaxID=3252649 RepID=UPI0036142A6C
MNRQPTDENRIADDLIELFSGKQERTIGPQRSLADHRGAIHVEVTLRPFICGFDKQWFGVELRLGPHPNKMYIVHRIRDFLRCVERRVPYVMTRHFTYEPELHRFDEADAALINELSKVYAYELMYRDTLSGQVPGSRAVSGDRMLLIPSFAWGDMEPMLSDAPNVLLASEKNSVMEWAVTDEPLPLLFTIDQGEQEPYQLAIDGLDPLILMDDYRLVLNEGKVHRIAAEQSKRLRHLMKTLGYAGQAKISLEAKQMETFMHSVIPGLMKLGRVEMADSVADRMLHAPLRAKLYLDRVRNRLLAALEFQYGDIVINPIESAASTRGSELILVRDAEGERAILELMEQGSFNVTESGFMMDNEESEFDFLTTIVPKLEERLTVYATSAVRSRIHTGPMDLEIKVEVDERTDWLDFKVDMGTISESEIRQLLKSLQEKRKYHRLSSGALLPLDNERYQAIIRYLNEAGLKGSDWREGGIRIPAARGLAFLNLPLPDKGIKLGKSFRKLLDHMRSPDHLDFPIPVNLAPVLRDYQAYGYQWMKTLAHYRFGGILADDMGLGKTIQSIAFLVSVLPQMRERRTPSLVIAPSSLIYNWHNELKRFAPEVKVLLMEGSKQERTRLFKTSIHEKADVIITSYPLLRQDLSHYAKLSFHTLILDEAQVFKNDSTLTAQAVKSIQADYRYALTGTPIENSLVELWSIFGAVFPELFPERREFQELSRESIARKIRPFMLRRLKSDVLKELPDKIETIQSSKLLPAQNKLYVAYLVKLQQETLKHMEEKSLDQNRIRILAGITRLRQLCCHPALFVEGYEGGSGKLEQLLDVIEECRNAGKRVLIFSQFTEMLGMISRELGYQGAAHFYLDGQTPARERVQLCSRFNEGERELFLISLKAGGTGLNLTGADTVILYDLWWNPAVEQQAADRAHRIGQKKVVQVIRLVAQGTIEDKMYELQLKKKNLIDEVINEPGHESITSFSEQELREILSLE